MRKEKSLNHVDATIREPFPSHAVSVRIVEVSSKRIGISRRHICIGDTSHYLIGVWKGGTNFVIRHKSKPIFGHTVPMS
jgi:hypothetical protein